MFVKDNIIVSWLRGGLSPGKGLFRERLVGVESLNLRHGVLGCVSLGVERRVVEAQITPEISLREGICGYL